MITLASWGRPFRVWHYSVSYSRLLLRSVDEKDFPGRVDVLFSNVRLMHTADRYASLEISTEIGWSPPAGDPLGDVQGEWFLLNAGAGYVHATHCQWHEDDGNAMTPSRFGPFRRTD